MVSREDLRALHSLMPASRGQAHTEEERTGAELSEN